METSIAGAQVVREFKGWSHQASGETKGIPKEFQKAWKFREGEFRTLLCSSQGAAVIRLVKLIVVLVIGIVFGQCIPVVLHFLMMCLLMLGRRGKVFVSCELAL